MLVTHSLSRTIPTAILTILDGRTIQTFLGEAIRTIKTIKVISSSIKDNRETTNTPRITFLRTVHKSHQKMSSKVW